MFAVISFNFLGCTVLSIPSCAFWPKHYFPAPIRVVRENETKNERKDLIQIRPGTFVHTE